MFHSQEYFSSLYNILKYLFIYYLYLAAFGLCCGVWAFHHGGLSCCGARAPAEQASVVVAHGLSSCGLRAPEHRPSSCSTEPSHFAACGVLPDQGLNPHPLHCQAGSEPLHHQRSPYITFLIGILKCNSR